ncbi:uncharacterized protein LOC121381425 [Gigantopelta aegis]|uniref:uncharacterized protein LOC121381425 n=1 Tax=Gigantopelta aegis TaxID=1735272 RepID=UPI001B889DC0|nr:uncharacterized protein LOC121381425 [Gigantopelta aegis]
MVLTAEEERAYQMTDTCHICQGKRGFECFLDPATNGDNAHNNHKLRNPFSKVRDHDHLTGVYRGAAHSKCNLQYQFRKNKGKKSKLNEFFIPVVFHNLKGYDSHLIMKYLNKSVKQNLSCLANNLEKYISFSVGNLRFIDSLQFLNASLDTLVNNLKTEGSDKFRHLSKECSNQKQLDLLLRKGVYPYDYMDDSSKFDRTQLPNQNDFFNILTESDITDADYEHAQNVWSTFELKNMGEYHDLYMKTDVLLLADVFENFRDLCLEYYHLDSAHYFTLSGVGWDAMLRMGNVQLELLTDIDMHLMIEQGLRGGISMISKKFAKANNHYLETYNERKPSTYLMYLDANNLYGHSMSQYLPEREFQWVEDLDSLDIMNITENSNIGYILEVDFEYPTELHDRYSDYPLASESMSVTDDILSPHSHKLRETLCLTGRPVKKLVPNLNDKKKYVLHYRNLQFYLSQGLKLKEIHRAIQFKQSPWLKPYIDFNTEKRKQSKN